MADINAKVLVVGGGPGGYVTAIRAGQLGLDVVLAEQGGRDGGLGGTCLNVGCIPSKALIHAAELFHAAVEQADRAPLGIRVEKPTLELARTMEWKDGVVGRLTGGVGTLLKRHNVKILQGRAEMVDGKSCRIETDTGPQLVRAEHVVLATGSEPVPLPGLPFGGKVISSTATKRPAIVRSRRSRPKPSSRARRPVATRIRSAGRLRLPSPASASPSADRPAARAPVMTSTPSALRRRSTGRTRSAS